MLREMGTPCLINQVDYSMLDRWIEPELLDAAAEEGVGLMIFSPLAQGMLTDRYLNGIPQNSRAAGISPFLAPGPHHARIPGAGARSQRYRPAARANSGADGAGLGAAT